MDAEQLFKMRPEQVGDLVRKGGAASIGSALTQYLQRERAEQRRRQLVLARLGPGWSIDGDDLVHTKTGRYVGAARRSA